MNAFRPMLFVIRWYGEIFSRFPQDLREFREATDGATRLAIAFYWGLALFLTVSVITSIIRYGIPAIRDLVKFVSG